MLRRLLLPKPLGHQIDIILDGHRHKRICAGRRFGKTLLGMIAVLDGHAGVRRSHADLGLAFSKQGKMDQALKLLDSAACKAGSSREELVLALADKDEAKRFKREHGVDPRATTGLLQLLLK